MLSGLSLCANLESLEMVQRYTRSVTFEDSMKHYRAPLSWVCYPDASSRPDTRFQARPNPTATPPMNPVPAVVCRKRM